MSKVNGTFCQIFIQMEKGQKKRKKEEKKQKNHFMSWEMKTDRL